MNRRMLGVPVAAGLLGLAACGGHGGSTGSPDAPPAQVVSPSSSVLAPAGGIFGAQSVFKTDISKAPVAADSAQLVAHLASTVADRYGGVAAFNAHQYDTSLDVAPAGTPTTDVGFYDCQGKGSFDPALRAQLSGIPITAGATPAPGSDSGLSVWQPSTDTLWELWRARRTATGWEACYGGRIDHVSTSPGYFTGGFGETATGIAAAGGMVGIADVQSGAIDHAVALNVVDARAGAYSWPAQREDGTSTDPAAIPEGTRLRLDPSIDVTTLGLTPIATMIAKAAQTYGFVVTDRSGAVAVLAEDPTADQRATGTDPWASLEQGVPDYAVLKGFPWDRLQALPQSWGEPAG